MIFWGDKITLSREKSLFVSFMLLTKLWKSNQAWKQGILFSLDPSTLAHPVTIDDSNLNDMCFPSNLNCVGLWIVERWRSPFPIAPKPSLPLKRLMVWTCASLACTFRSMAPTALRPTRGKGYRAAFWCGWKAKWAEELFDVLGLEMQILDCSIEMKPKTQSTAQYCFSVVILIRRVLWIAAWDGKETLLFRKWA